MKNMGVVLIMASTLVCSFNQRHSVRYGEISTI
ncbi:MAG: hypothetical protein ACI9LG_000213 [Moritella dasanensis]|jgi:hypothetical protein